MSEHIAKFGNNILFFGSILENDDHKMITIKQTWGQ